jgi:hypothetical protein
VTARDFSVLSSELQRKHQLLLTVWNALDTKIGVLLGFTVVVLFGLVLNTEVINSMAISTQLVWPFNPSTFVEANSVAFWMFWFAFAAFVFVFVIGITAISVKTFEDIETIDEADEFLENSSMTPELFSQKLGSLFYDYIIENEKHVKKKGFYVRIMTVGFVIGTALFLIRFGIVVFL